MPSPKDRQNSGISMLEKEQAREVLVEAYKAILMGSPEWAKIRLMDAMRMLDMKPVHDSPPCGYARSAYRKEAEANEAAFRAKWGMAEQRIDPYLSTMMEGEQ